MEIGKSFYWILLVCAFCLLILFVFHAKAQAETPCLCDPSLGGALPTCCMEPGPTDYQCWWPELGSRDHTVPCPPTDNYGNPLPESIPALAHAKVLWEGPESVYVNWLASGYTIDILNTLINVYRDAAEFWYHRAEECH